MKAERELREWIRLILGDAATETRVSEIAEFVVQRWEHNPKFSESVGGRNSDSSPRQEDDDPIDSWDEGSSVGSRNFCGYELDEDLVGAVWKLVDEAWNERESAIRFYGLNSLTSKMDTCHCKKLRGTGISLAETMPADRHHMLVRDPPPWDSVYAPNIPPPRKIKLRAKPSLSDSSHFNPNRSNARSTKSRQEIWGMITQRSLPSVTTLPFLPSAPTSSVNPFLKRPNVGLTHEESKYQGFVQDGNSDSISESLNPKRMKYIS